MPTGSPAHAGSDYGNGTAQKNPKGYNRRHGITPESIVKKIASIFESVYEADYVPVGKAAEAVAEFSVAGNPEDMIRSLEKEMIQAADALAFEKAAALRDQIKHFEKNCI
jgi:excinuclease ABC subunit B